MDYIIKGDDTKDKAILTHIGISIQEWLQHAYNEKARVCVDRIVEVTTTHNPKKMAEADKHAIVKGLTFEPQSDERQVKDLAHRIVATK